MASRATFKRQNFNVTPDEEAEIQRLREALCAPSVKDALLRATRVVLTLAKEVQEGKQVYSGQPGSGQTRLLLPDFEANTSQWTYLCPRVHSWKSQLFVKGRKLTAANVWFSMQANDVTETEAAADWDLPLEAIQEIVRYCESHRGLIGMEADEELCLLAQAGVTMTARERA